MNDSTPFSDARIDDYILQAKLITAIKRHRELTNSSLQEAKDYVEARQEALWGQYPERFLKTPKIVPRETLGTDEVPQDD